MGAQVALLRGINVGGKNKLPMKALVTIFEGAGAREVSTYIQSGNVVFEATKATVAELPGKVEAAIREEFGHDVPLVMRSARELRSILDSNPFVAEGVDPKSLHVGFLAKRPSAKNAASLDPERSPPDRFALRGADLYLHCPSGMGRTKLTNRYLDTKLDTITTMRNWKTVNALAELAGA